MEIDTVLDDTRKRILSTPPLSYDREDLEELHIEFTYGCNLRCRMCDVWKRYRTDRRLPAKEMDAEELVDYIQESQYLQRVQRVILSGGEPFLKKDLASLVEYFSKIRTASSDIGILSNLYSEKLTLRRLEEINERTNRTNLWIGTSLDGMKLSHNQTRGKEDAFQKFCSTLSEVRKRFPSVALSVNFTLTPDNARDLYAVYRFCRSEGLGFSYQFPVPWEEAEIFRFPEVLLQEIESTTRRMVEEKVSEARDTESVLPEIFYLDGNVKYHKDPQRVFPACAAGSEFVTISPLGEIYFCPPLKRTIVGELRKDPFDTIWTSREARRLRKWISRGKCHCWLNCTVYPNVRRALLANSGERENEERLPLWKRWRRCA